MRVPLVTGGRLDLDRDDMSATFSVPEPLSDADLLHPYLAPAAAWFSHWLGRHSFHAGCVVFGGRAYAVAGDKEAGKSSLLAWLSIHGHTVVADDLVVLDGERILTGPRAIDLRAPTVEALALASAVDVRGGTRHRIALSQTEAEWPFGGWIFLSWGPRIEIRSIPPRDRLATLLASRVAQVVPHNPADLVALAARPAWTLARPRGWDVMDRLSELVSSTVAG
ncbi:MAG TPA: hypothetical protein VG318_09905 [Actinomycetota bacterium]|nr:hypothetical protein [Actinomycetota bacterium]